MGHKLIKFYFAFWAIWFAFGIATNHQEFATYLGSDRWTMEKSVEREKARWQFECNEKRIECALEEFDQSSVDFVTEDQVTLVIWMFVAAMIKAPLYFFLLLVAVYWSIKFIRQRLKI